MTTLEEALKDARKAGYLINRCEETENAYVFFHTSAADQIGGHGSPIAVLKENGKFIPYALYVTKHSRPTVREPFEV